MLAPRLNAIAPSVTSTAHALAAIKPGASAPPGRRRCGHHRGPDATDTSTSPLAIFASSTRASPMSLRRAPSENTDGIGPSPSNRTSRRVAADGFYDATARHKDSLQLPCGGVACCRAWAAKMEISGIADLVRQLLEARDTRELTRLQQQLLRVDVLIVDELGFVPFDRTGGELLFNLLTDRYERRATVVTINLAFAEWVTVFAGDEKLTTALLDRLAHHATVLTTRGKSYRMRKRRAAEGSPS
jgi:hypothetical protein